MNFRYHFETAWQTTLKFIGPAILLTLVQFAVMILSIGILAPVTTAGYMQSLLRALREGRPPEIRDLFSEMSLFLPLFVFFLLVMIASGIGFMLLVLPGFVVVAFIVFATLYMIPLMTDRRLGIMDALRQSWEMAVREPVTDQIIITVLYILIVSLGGSVPFGFLLTQPFAMFLLLSFYQERLQGVDWPNEDQPQEPPTPPPIPPVPSE